MCPGVKGVYGVKYMNCLLGVIKPNSGFKIQPHKLTSWVNWEARFKHFSSVKLEHYSLHLILSSKLNTWQWMHQAQKHWVKVISLPFPTPPLSFSSLEWLPSLSCKQPGIKTRYTDYRNSRGSLVSGVTRTHEPLLLTFPPSLTFQTSYLRSC